MDERPNVLFLGSPYWCQHLSRLLNEHQLLHAYTWKRTFGWLVSRHKSICLVGLGPPDTHKRFLYHLAAFVLQQLRIVDRRIIYWIGSDVSRLRKKSRFVAGAVNIAGSAWLAEEVCGHGFACKERLFPVELPVRDKLPFPKKTRLQVLCYMPDAYHELHGSSEIRATAEALTDADFTIIGGTGSWWPGFPGNVRFLGWTNDVVECLAEAHVLLRRTSHDSLSAFVREGLVAGRQVVFTYDFPGTIYVASGDTEALIARVREFRDRNIDGRLEHSRLDPEVRNRLVDTRAQLKALLKDYG